MEKLHNVPCVQFSFSNDNTVLSESVEWAVNVIADSIDSLFSMIIIWGNPRIQAATVIWVESEATSWVKHMEGTKDKSTLENIVEEGWQRGLEGNKGCSYSPFREIVHYQDRVQFSFMVLLHSKLGWLVLWQN